MKTSAISFKGLETTIKGGEEYKVITSQSQDIQRMAAMKSYKPENLRDASVNSSVGNYLVRLETIAGDTIICDRNGLSTTKGADNQVVKWAVRNTSKQDPAVRKQLSLLHVNLIELANEYARRLKK